MLNYLLYGVPFQTDLVIRYLGMVEPDNKKSGHKMKGYEIEVIDTAVDKRKKRSKIKSQFLP